MTEGVAFVDGIIQAAREVLADGATDLHDTSQGMMEMALIATIRTPHPQAQEGFFLGEPMNEPWISLYTYYTEAVLPLTVALIALAIALILFTGIFGTLLSGYEKSKAKRRLVVAFLFVIAWWSIGAFTLRFADALATTIAPPPDDMAATLQETMALEGVGTVSTAGLAVVEAGVFVALILTYLIRWIGVYALMVGMPLAVAFWIVDIGPFAYLSSIVADVAFKFVPLAFITVPAAIIYRVGDLVFGVFDPVQAFGHATAPFMLGLAVPLLVLIVSYYLFLKTPGVRSMTAEPNIQLDSERAPVEKGREEPRMRRRTEVHRDSDISSTGEAPGRPDTPSYSSAANHGTRGVRRYDLPDSTGGGYRSRHDFHRSRRKVRDTGGGS